MNSTFKYKSLKVGTFCLCLYLFSIAIVRVCESTQKSDKRPISWQPIIYQLKKAIKTKNYDTLKKYVPHKKLLYWAQCNTDVSIDVSFNKMERLLMKNSKDALIVVDEIPAGGLIETEGWTGEYPYLYFQFTKNENNWQWLGVCFDINRSLDFALSRGGKDKLYDKPPKLPRRGPRIFKDEIALRARIEEILRFMEFEALKPYAIRQKLIFGECGQKMMDSDEIKGVEASIDQVISFLKKNVGNSKEIKPSKGHYYKYLETEGWRGAYPYVSFWFKEGKQGWELEGVAYCKTSLMKVLFPNDPRIK